MLKTCVSMVRDGGLIAFQEYDLALPFRSYPEMSSVSHAAGQITEFFCRALPKPDIGTQLFHLMQEAGLPPAECRAECLMDGGPCSPFYEWIAETVISLSARFEAVGMAPLENTDGASLTQQLREEAIQKRGVLAGPVMVGAFAKKKAASRNC